MIIDDPCILLASFTMGWLQAMYSSHRIASHEHDKQVI